MLKRILDDTRQALLQEESRLLADMRVVLVRLDASAESQKALARSIAQLDEPFLLVVVGEYNAGKSALINALVGEQVLVEGVTPTTSRIGQLRYGPAAGRAAAGAGSEVITLPLDVLREITIVDTPGTNSVLRDHEALTREFVPRSDLVLFVTSADRPFSESERAFLEAIQSWGKKVMVALNKVDILETPEDVDAAASFVKEQALALLGLRPRVFTVSARQARRAKAEANDGLLRASGFIELESFVTQTLNEAVRLRLKLLNPLGVGLRVGGEAEALVEERLAFLDVDSAVLEAADGQLTRQREDLGRDLRLRFADVERVLANYEKRAGDCVDRTLRFQNLFALMDRERTRGLFEREAVGNLFPVLEKGIDEIVGWLVATEGEHWRVVTEHVRRRQAAHGAPMTGLEPLKVEHDGSQLLQDVRREAQRVLEDDPRAQARRFADAARGAARGVLVLEAVAVGLAAWAVALAPAGWARVSGLFLAGALSLLGLLVLPALRQRTAAELRQKTGVWREALVSRLKASLDRELEENRRRALEALHPYREFVRSETERLRAQLDQLRTLRTGFEALRDRLQRLA